MIVLDKTKFYKPVLKAQYLLGFLFLMMYSSCSLERQYIKFHGNTMGTTYSILIVPSLDNEIDITIVQMGIDSVLNEVNDQMSTYLINSEISNFNESRVGQKTLISNGFNQVVERSLYWSELTDGAFDPTVFPVIQLWRIGSKENKIENIWQPPSNKEIRESMSKVGFNKIKLKNSYLEKRVEGQMIDLNAIAKGWGVDEIFTYLTSLGFKNYLVEIGGEVRTNGKNNKNRYWGIGVEKPIKNSLPGEHIYGKIDLNNKGMATSGNYRNFYEFNGNNYSHIIDPRNGMSINSSTLSITVIAKTCMDADALATALSVLSYDEGLNLIRSLEGVEALWIMEDSNGDFVKKMSTGMPFIN
tara:strand:- start:12 stop:1082 length:1071 start_codon:yes stop_codon:yes gene_type:complete